MCDETAAARCCNGAITHLREQASIAEQITTFVGEPDQVPEKPEEASLQASETHRFPQAFGLPHLCEWLHLRNSGVLPFRSHS